MHFVDSLFTILQQEVSPDGGNFRLRLNADHPIYKGHFPDNPITPGVCSLEIMTQLINANYQGFDHPDEIKSIKYLGFVNPLDTPEVDVELKATNTSEGNWRFRGALYAGGKPSVKMVASYMNKALNLKTQVS